MIKSFHIFICVFLVVRPFLWNQGHCEISRSHFAKNCNYGEQRQLVIIMKTVFDFTNSFCLDQSDILMLQMKS